MCVNGTYACAWVGVRLRAKIVRKWKTNGSGLFSITGVQVMAGRPPHLQGDVGFSRTVYFWRACLCPVLQLCGHWWFSKRHSSQGVLWWLHRCSLWTSCPSDSGFFHLRPASLLVWMWPAQGHPDKAWTLGWRCCFRLVHLQSHAESVETIRTETVSMETLFTTGSTLRKVNFAIYELFHVLS